MVNLQSILDDYENWLKLADSLWVPETHMYGARIKNMASQAYDGRVTSMITHRNSTNINGTKLNIHRYYWHGSLYIDFHMPNKFRLAFGFFYTNDKHFYISPTTIHKPLTKDYLFDWDIERSRKPRIVRHDADVYSVSLNMELLGKTTEEEFQSLIIFLMMMNR